MSPCRIAPGQNITDFGGNTFEDTTPFGTNTPTFTVDNLAPTATSVDNVQPGTSPTNADTLIWAIFFSEGLSNLDLADIQLTGTTATITEITNPQPNLYAFTASGGDLAGYNGAVTIELAPGHDVRDGAGNTLTSLVPTGALDERAVIVDNTVPTLVSFTRLTPATEQTDADSLVFRATFSEIAINVTADDFVVTGTTASITDVSAPAVGTPGPDPDLSGTAGLAASNVYDITVSGGDLANINAVVGLNVARGQNVTDRAGNAFAGGEPATDETYNVVNDIIPPRIVSITRVSPTTALTAADSVTWQITFDETVSGLDVSDFVLSGTTAGLTIPGTPASIFLETPAAGGDLTQATIIATGGDLAELTGTITLGFAAGQDITDAIGNALVNLTPTGANDNAFNIDNTDPTPTISAPGTFSTLDPFVVTITFDEPVLFFTDLGEVTATNATVTAPSGSGTTYTATVTPNGNGDVEIGVLAQAALDLTLVNYNVAATPVTVARDAVAPAVTLASTASDPAAGDLIVSASFTEAVSGLELSDFVITNGTGSNFQQLTPSIYFIRVTPTADGLVTVGLPAGVANDGVGNASLAATDYSVTADNTRPVPVISGAPASVNSTAPFDVTVTFSEPVFFFTDVGEVSAFNASVTAPVGSGSTYTATITPQTEGDILIGVIEGAALDNTFVNSNVAANYVQVVFDATAPRLTSVERLNPANEQTNADALTWRVRFDEDVASVDAADFALTGTSGAVTGVTGSGEYIRGDRIWRRSRLHGRCGFTRPERLCRDLGCRRQCADEHVCDGSGGELYAQEFSAGSGDCHDHGTAGA
jgi:hypothetical protein